MTPACGTSSTGIARWGLGVDRLSDRVISYGGRLGKGWGEDAGDTANSQVIVHQFDTYVFELDVQLRAEGAADWKTVQHVGRVGKRLPKIVASRFEPRKVTGLRIVSIKGGPSFTVVGASSGSRIAFTPGIASAALVSMLRIFACAYGLNKSRANSMPGARKSSEYLARPVTFARISGVS